MKIIVPEKLNIIDVIKKSGYGLPASRSSHQLNFIRRLGSSNYPHFHAYLEGQVINLHLDQKQPSYGTNHAHSGEYDGETVEREASRIQDVISSIMVVPDAENKSEAKTSWWKKIF